MSRPPGSSSPRTARQPGDIRRAQILREAKALFGTRGFKGTTTRDVAKHVGITEAALYRYFPSKDAMYAAILEERTASPDMIQPLEPLIRTRDDQAVFTGLALAMLRSVGADPSLLRLLLYSALEGHELSQPFYEKRIQRVRDALVSYIETRIREGAFRKVDPSLAARALIGMVIDHLIVREIFHQQQQYPQSIEQVAETYVSIFLDGVRSQDSSSHV